MKVDLAQQLGLEQRHMQIVMDLLARHVPERTVYAFGSRTFGHARRYSDLALAIAGEKPLRATEHYDLVDAFDESMLPIEVDVLDLNDVEEGFRKRIEPDFVLLQQRFGVNP